MMTPFGPHTQRARQVIKSHRVGRARQPDGHVTTAYRAVQPHVCAPCGATIAVGDLFSRRVQSGTSMFLADQTRERVCMTCCLLRLEEDDDDKRQATGEVSEEPGGQG